MLKRRCFVTLLFLMICICAVSAVSASDFNETFEVIGDEASDEVAISDDDVLSKDPGTYSDLSKQIKKNAGGKITLSRDYLYVEDIDEWDAGSFIGIENDITIYGRNHVIYCNDASGFNIDEGVSVKIYNVTFAGEYNNPELPAYWGGAISNYGTLYLENCSFIKCQAETSGGAISNYGTLNLKQCGFMNCQADVEGGAIYNGGKMKVNMCYFKANSADKSKGLGGAISNDNDEMLVNGTYFADNVAKEGGAIYTAGIARIENCVFGTLVDEEVKDDEGMFVGSNKANQGVSIYNDVSDFCSVNGCLFNETKISSNAAVIYNAIASDCQFEAGNNVNQGVIKNCTTKQKSFSNTINSTGFTFTANPSIDTYYNSGQDLEITVTSSPGGERVSNVAIELVVDGKSEYIITNSSGVATFEASKLTPGNHKIVVGLYDENFGKQQQTVPVTVKTVKLSIAVSKLTTTYKSGKKWTIKVTDETNNQPAENMDVKLKVYTGSKTKTYTVTTNSKGIATFKASDLDKGTHKVILSINGKGYDVEPVTSSIKIKAKKLLIAGQTNKFKHGGQVIVGAYDNAKKKLVSGIKLQIKIFTGKKYRTFNLVTKKSKAIGDIGVLIETNAFSVGTHKVTVKVTSANYYGSDSGKLVIPKSAKNYKKFTYVISNGKGKYV